MFYLFCYLERYYWRSVRNSTIMYGSKVNRYKHENLWRWTRRCNDAITTFFFFYLTFLIVAFQKSQLAMQNDTQNMKDFHLLRKLMEDKVVNCQRQTKRYLFAASASNWSSNSVDRWPRRNGCVTSDYQRKPLSATLLWWSSKRLALLIPQEAPFTTAYACLMHANP